MKKKACFAISCKQQNVLNGESSSQPIDTVSTVIIEAYLFTGTSLLWTHSNHLLLGRTLSSYRHVDVPEKISFFMKIPQLLEEREKRVSLVQLLQSQFSLRWSVTVGDETEDIRDLSLEERLIQAERIQLHACKGYLTQRSEIDLLLTLELSILGSQPESAILPHDIGRVERRHHPVEVVL